LSLLPLKGGSAQFLALCASLLLKSVSCIITILHFKNSSVEKFSILDAAGSPFQRMIHGQLTCPGCWQLMKQADEKPVHKDKGYFMQFGYTLKTLSSFLRTVADHTLIIL